MYSRFCGQGTGPDCRHLSQCSLLQHPAVCNLLGVTQPHSRRCDEILHHFCKQCKTHSPCSLLHARLADFVSETAGGLLPHPFTPYHTYGGSTLCCGCSHMSVTSHAPPLTVSWGNIPTMLPSRHRGRESGSSSADESPTATTAPASDPR